MFHYDAPVRLDGFDLDDDNQMQFRTERRREKVNKNVETYGPYRRKELN